MSSAETADLADLYINQRLSTTEIARHLGIPPSRARQALIQAGVHLRSRGDGVRLAFAKHGSPHKGRTREPFSAEWKANLSAARAAWGERNAVGTSVKPSGYIEYTRGPNKGRAVHVVAMEKTIGRRLRHGECVHHIDGNRANNDIHNLALVTTAGHARLHRREEALAGKRRERKDNGQLS